MYTLKAFFIRQKARCHLWLRYFLPIITSIVLICLSINVYNVITLYVSMTVKIEHNLVVGVKCFQQENFRIKSKFRSCPVLRTAMEKKPQRINIFRLHVYTCSNQNVYSNPIITERMDFCSLASMCLVIAKISTREFDFNTLIIFLIPRKM